MIALPATGYVGLTSGGTEIAGNNYARQAVLFTTTVDNLSVANIEGIVWPLAYPYGWGHIDTVQLYDAAGTLLTETVPVHSVTVHTYSSARIRPAGMVVAFGASVGRPYGMRVYGRGRYARDPTLQSWVDLIEIGFTQMDPCETGVWQPSEPCQAAAWEPVDLCQPGAWGPADKPLRRAA